MYRGPQIIEQIKNIEDKYLDLVSKLIGKENLSISKVGELDAKGTVDVQNVSYGINSDKTCIARFCLSDMPGCCGVVVSTGSYISYDYRGKGLGKLLNQMRKEICKAEGYGLLVCTDIAYNIPQQKVLKRNGWKRASSFINPRTDNHIYLHTYNLNNKPYEWKERAKDLLLNFLRKIKLVSEWG